MKKYIALAAAGAMALAVLVAGVAPSYAAQGWQGQNWQQNSDSWKKKQFQGKPNWQNHGNNFNGPPKFAKNNWPNNWNGPPQNWNNNNNWWKHKKPHYQNYNSGIPFVFGLALGATLASPYLYDPYPVYAGYTPHQLWCLRHYPNTYNPRTNTYYARPGVLAVCISPYSNPIGPFPY